MYYEVASTPGGFAEMMPRWDKPVIIPEPDQIVNLVCESESTVVYNDILPFDPAEPFGLSTASADAALLARELLPLPDPDIVTSPPADAAQLVGVATWFSVGAAWQAFSASATLGGVTATVTATPTEVAWEPGDGSPTITCAGPGTAFDPARPRATSDCTHTYIDDTAGATIDLTATITYDVAWTATDGTGDVLDPVTRTATVGLTIAQVQAVIR